MPQGLQVFNADGSLQFDSSNRLFRVLTSQVIGADNGSMPVPIGPGSVAVSVRPNGSGAPPNVSVGGGNVTWSYDVDPGLRNESATLTILEF